MWQKLFLIFLASSLLSGCFEYTPESMLENYTSRLERVLESSPEKPPIETIPLFPLKRDRLAKTEELREGLIDVLKLKACDLVPLIAERNSSLGKVFQPSQKLAYELNFFQRIQQCRAKLLLASSLANPALVEQVESIYQIKRANFPAEIWNGIFLSPAVENNFSVGGAPLSLTEDGTTDASIKAFTTFTTYTEFPLIQNWQLPDLAKFEDPYATLHRNRSGSEMLASLVLLTSYLQHAANIIEQRLSDRALCFNEQPTPKAKILQNVFFKYYIGEVQPYLAKVHKFATAWRDQNLVMLKNFRQADFVIPKTVETYMDQVMSDKRNDSLWQQYISARDKHTQSWQKILKQCGMMPTR